MKYKPKERKIYKVENIEDIKFPYTSNFVIVEVKEKNDHIKLKNGLKLYVDTSYNKSEHADRVFAVVRPPEKLYFSKKPHATAMTWETEQELKAGDDVLIGFMHSLNMPMIKCKEKEYFLAHYSELYCARRNGEYIPLNGYVIMDEVIREERLLDYTVDKVDNRGVIKYLGKPNKQYMEKEYSDGADVSVGDTVLLENNGKHIITEHPTHASFFGGEVYFLVQRKEIIAKL